MPDIQVVGVRNYQIAFEVPQDRTTDKVDENSHIEVCFVESPCLYWFLVANIASDVSSTTGHEAYTDRLNVKYNIHNDSVGTLVINTYESTEDHENLNRQSFNHSNNGSPGSNGGLSLEVKQFIEV